MVTLNNIILFPGSIEDLNQSFEDKYIPILLYKTLNYYSFPIIKDKNKSFKFIDLEKKFKQELKSSGYSGVVNYSANADFEMGFFNFQGVPIKKIH